MAICNHERVGNALHLLRAGLRPLAAEALSYNGLVQSWPEITRLAREGGKARPEQAALFENE